jgi:hypothetical protein
MVSNANGMSPLVRNVVCVPIAVVTLGVVTLWILPEVLTRHPSRDMASVEQLKAVNDVRTPLVAFVVAIGAAGTVWFTARTYILNRRGNVTDRYTRAVGQLGDESSPVRVGGIYALERIANDSARDRATIVYLLGAFIRERSKVTPERQNEPSEDVKTGLRVASRLLRMSDVTLDLRDADLRYSDLSGIPYDQVMLDGAKTEGATPPRHP